MKKILSFSIQPTLYESAQDIFTTLLKKEGLNPNNKHHMWIFESFLSTVSTKNAANRSYFTGFAKSLLKSVLTALSIPLQDYPQDIHASTVREAVYSLLHQLNKADPYSEKHQKIPIKYLGHLRHNLVVTSNGILFKFWLGATEIGLSVFKKASFKRTPNHEKSNAARVQVTLQTHTSHYFKEGSFGYVQDATIVNSTRYTDPPATTYVVKILKAGKVDSFREACLQDQLTQHTPGIPKIIALAETEEEPFIMMEKVGTTTLADVLKSSTLTESNRLDLIRKFLDILPVIKLLHSVDILHRDLKPDNIIVGNNGLFLIDFGTACHISDEENMSMRAGNKFYMAPEIKESWSWTVKNPKKAELFSLGMILQEICGVESDFSKTSLGKRIQDTVIERLLSYAEDRPSLFEAGLLLRHCLRDYGQTATSRL